MVNFDNQIKQQSNINYRKDAININNKPSCFVRSNLFSKKFPLYK